MREAIATTILDHPELKDELMADPAKFLAKVLPGSSAEALSKLTIKVVDEPMDTLVLPIPADANVMGVYVELLWYNRPRHVGEGALVVATDEGEIHRHVVNTANVQSITRFEVPANQIDSLTLSLSGISKPGYLLYLQRLKFRYLYE